MQIEMTSERASALRGQCCARMRRGRRGSNVGSSPKTESGHVIDSVDELNAAAAAAAVGEAAVGVLCGNDCSDTAAPRQLPMAWEMSSKEAMRASCAEERFV